jgi:hypothetical protein
MRQAADQDARLIHFPEGHLTGYAKEQVRDWSLVDWDAARHELEQIAALAAELRLWVVLGSAHPLTQTMHPEYEFALEPGQILVLPRGWMHNPHARDQTEESVHVTFVGRERTGYWIARKLAQAALTSTPLRRVIPPASVVDPAAFAGQIAEARDLLVDWLAGADVSTLAAELLQDARTEPNVDYISHAPRHDPNGQHQTAP